MYCQLQAPVKQVFFTILFCWFLHFTFQENSPLSIKFKGIDQGPEFTEWRFLFDPPLPWDLDSEVGLGTTTTQWKHSHLSVFVALIPSLYFFSLPQTGIARGQLACASAQEMPRQECLGKSSGHGGAFSLASWVSWVLFDFLRRSLQSFFPTKGMQPMLF